MDDALRAEIGDRVLIGHGVEFGAGLKPSLFAQVEGLAVIDKRTSAELTELFGQKPPYAVLSPEQGLELRGSADFVTAHHVLEHCPDPIGTLAAWLSLLCVGGRLYISVPSPANVCEDRREVTPLDHLLRDHLNGADGTDFDSRQHIPAFLSQWTVMGSEPAHYAQNGVEYFASHVLSELRRTEGHDAHWHTFDQASLAGVLATAGYIAGARMAVIEQHDNGQSLHLVAEREAGIAPCPPFLTALLEEWSERVRALLPRRHKAQAWLRLGASLFRPHAPLRS